VIGARAIQSLYGSLGSMATRGIGPLMAATPSGTKWAYRMPRSPVPQNEVRRLLTIASNTGPRILPVFTQPPAMTSARLAKSCRSIGSR
jgi:hypothetical protein